MRFLAPSQTEDLQKLSPIVWTSAADDPAFLFEIPPGKTGFLGFFLHAARGATAPKLFFDTGSGFSELTAVTLKAFPFAFYHVSLDKMRDVQRVRFRPCAGTATFRFLALETESAVTVAVLHFLFNLRYQNVGITSADRTGRTGLVAWFRSNVTRITKFFRDVSAGAGLGSQEGSKNVLPAMTIFQSFEADFIEKDLEKLFEGRTGGPLISFVSPTYNTSTAYLTDLLQSFATQKAAYAELILSDDGSTDPDTLAELAAAGKAPGVQVVFNARNAGIAAATNAGIARAKGDWVAFIDHDDQFVPGAIPVIVKAIHDHPDADFFYTDEIIADGALLLVGAFCKPAFDSVLLSGSNYINHFSIFRRDRLERIGGLRIDREGSQDYDLLLRYLAGAKPGSVVHIPFMAYVWRREDRSYSQVHVRRSVDNARLALQAGFEAAGRRVHVRPALDENLHRVCFDDGGPPPLVSVIIPNKDSFALISRIVADLRQRTAYPRIEIVVVDNGTKDAQVLAFYDALGRDDPATVVDIVEEPFNFARMCNRGAARARGDVLLFLNNDIEVRDADWLTEMTECLAFAATGIVGAKLLYPNGLVQHNGVIVGLGDAAGHWYIGEDAENPGPMGRFNVRQTLSAVTGACMLVTRPCFDAVGGFDEVAFPIAYNDIDFCLRARDAGFRTIWTPFARLTHHESTSRGSDEAGENNIRFKVEFARLQARHKTLGFIDDAYSPFYDRRYSKPHIKVPERLPSPRPNRFS